MRKITAINNAIHQAISNIVAKAGKALQEPDYVAAMVVEMPQLLNASGAFPGVRFSGCFIHQSPKATFAGKYADPSICEIGDLLVLCHNIVDGDHRYNAALIQWKKSKTGGEKISGNTLKQLDLYEHWPKFKLDSTGTKEYDIYPKTVTPGAQYGIIKTNTPEELFCTIPSIALTIQDAVTFSRFLINLMKWQTGRPFDLNPANVDDSWSLLITNLIKASLVNTFIRRNFSPHKQSRTSDGFLSLLTNVDFVEAVIGEDPFEEDAPNGPSILFIDMAAVQRSE